MRKITVFNSVSLDGYFTGENGDLSWAHASPDDKEWSDFVARNARGDGGILLFGRVTIVASRTLKDAKWQNTTVANDLLTTFRALKEESGDDIVVLGSGTIVSQLAQHNLIDAYQIVVLPIVLGKGRTMFDGLDKKVNLRLTASRSFKNGNVFNTYAPA